MTNEESTEIVSFITPGTGGLVPGFCHNSLNAKMHYDFWKLPLHLGGWFKQTQKNSFDMPIDSDCFNRLHCSFTLSLLIIILNLMGLLICKYEPFWQEVSVESLILRWPLRSMGLLLTLATETLLRDLLKQTFVNLSNI